MTTRRGKVALVAGGAGFVGSHLVDSLLARGMRVICIDSFVTGLARNLRHLEGESRFELIVQDVIDPLPATLEKMPLGYVFNLACPASPPHYQADPEHTLLTNVMGTRNLLRLAESTGARFLLASTSEVYGDPEQHPQTEDYRGSVSCTGPRACYDEGKRAAETLAFDFQRLGRCQVRVARIFNTYGRRMRADDGRVVSNLVCQALAGDDITIYGDGSQSRSFCYVSDLVAGLMKLMDSETAIGPVNLGNPIELNMVELAELILQMTNSSSRLVSRPLPIDDPRRRRPNIDLAWRLLGWKPKVPLHEGLEATIDWFWEGAGRDPAPALPLITVTTVPSP
jgi:UDP-glucuronate decarboxylase